jgi:hypothetical protein
VTKTVKLPSGIEVPWTKDMLWLPDACPKKDEHSPFPRDMNFGNGMSKTHRQAKHETCGLWAIWVPR